MTNDNTQKKIINVAKARHMLRNKIKIHNVENEMLTHHHPFIEFTLNCLSISLKWDTNDGGHKSQIGCD